MNAFFNLKGQNTRRWGLVIALVLFGLSTETEAQSGRRGAKSSTSVTPGASPAAATEHSNSESAKQPVQGVLPSRVRLLVATQLTSKHLQSEDVISATFVKRLNQYGDVHCSSIGDIKQREAVVRAKTETDGLVVLLKFDIDSYQHRTIILNSQDLQIEYFVFAPRTGKKQTKGKVYFQAIGGGRMRRSDRPNGKPIKITAEAAGIEAAEDLYAWLALTAASRPRPE
ncbi:MAG: hypothetical protein M3Y84_13255 [Acidobacteriota bacterium]|nr:hypothetical protein [Acidobacteriota bacterium]